MSKRNGTLFLVKLDFGWQRWMFLWRGDRCTCIPCALRGVWQITAFQHPSPREQIQSCQPKFCLAEKRVPFLLLMIVQWSDCCIARAAWSVCRTWRGGGQFDLHRDHGPKTASYFSRHLERRARKRGGRGRRCVASLADASVAQLELPCS